MCGIAGFFRRGRLVEPQIVETLKLMKIGISARGPDAIGTWVDPRKRGGFVHTRLEIVGLGSLGDQPMISHCGRFVIVFNGEIYNYRALAKDLQLTQSNSRSDTKVLLELIVRNGLDYALKVIDGMFAFALFDNQEQSLTLCRDPFGEKPLYYYCDRDDLIFASDLKSIADHPDKKFEINDQAVADYLALKYVPEPASIFRDVFKVEPGTYWTINLSPELFKQTQTRFWCPVDAAIRAKNSPITARSVGDCADAVSNCLSSIIGNQVKADVPVGSFLSSGIDSSLIVSIASTLTPQSMPTYTLGAEDKRFDELNSVKKLNNSFGLHRGLVFDEIEALRAVEKVSDIYFEPFADSSQLASIALCAFASREVKTLLSGDGGDEIFGGYNRHQFAMSGEKLLRKMPARLRNLIAIGQEKVDDNTLERVLALFPNRFLPAYPSDKFRKMQKILIQNDSLKHYEVLTRNTNLKTHASSFLSNPRIEKIWNADCLTLIEKYMLFDTVEYLPGDILTKIDRASMAHGLEVRSPFLSRDLFSLSWSIPRDLRFNRAESKTVLRNALRKNKPSHRFSKKKGFSIPLDNIMRTTLKAQMRETILDSPHLIDYGFTSPILTKLIDTHLTKKRDLSSELWTIFNLANFFNRHR